ncbi:MULTISPECIES: hypothetical protein [unclassified Cupriavidus]|uniref:hypothetical protein n=1 Tax=unclassified Cupriavidus TaxID=2640874 RepID=UPI0010F92710|nr:MULTISPECIES: hypothetical protein [unclassified Cupriavidus]MWL85962.1 hypothetical protein [Cupriavidus sp. SW-Y-13]
MSRMESRTPFFKSSNRVRKRRVAMAVGGVVAAITAATVFLCIRPDTPAHASTKPAKQVATQAAIAAEAMASGALVTLADRHARDAVRIAEASDDDLGWDYVQLRL